MLLSGWLTQGPEVRAFEEEFAAYVGAKHAIAVTSGTVALELVLHALDVAGGEVVTVSHSFIATANVVRRSGAMPVFVDIAPGGFNIDPDRVAAAVGPKTQRSSRSIRSECPATCPPSSSWPRRMDGR